MIIEKKEDYDKYTDAEILEFAKILINNIKNGTPISPYIVIGGIKYISVTDLGVRLQKIKGGH